MRDGKLLVKPVHLLIEKVHLDEVNKLIFLTLIPTCIKVEVFSPSGSRSLVTPYSLSATWNAFSRRSRATRVRTERHSIRSGLNMKLQ